MTKHKIWKFQCVRLSVIERYLQKQFDFFVKFDSLFIGADKNLRWRTVLLDKLYIFERCAKFEAQCQGPIFSLFVKKHMKEYPNECRLDGKLVRNKLQHHIENAIKILRSSMEMMKFGTHKLCKNWIESLNSHTSHTKTQ